MPRNYSTNLILIVLAGVTWWLADRLMPAEDPDKSDASQVDYYSTQIRRTVLDVDGSKKNELFAQRMTHYKDDDRTEMDQPVQTLYSKQGEPWIIHAATGTSLSGGKTILLHGNVLITHKNDKGEEIKIITSNVKYLPETEYAETAEHVQMLGPNDESTATGAQVNFQPDLLINLLADVRRKHETQ